MKKLIVLIISFFSFNIHALAYSKAVVDITNMDVYEIQDAIDKGYLTYELLITMYLERIEEYDDSFNTIITINENAIEEAKEKDAIYQKKGRDSILFGIPIVVKDNIDVKGMPTTAGTKSLKESYPNDDADIIKNLKKEGAIILAKTNMSEFAFMASSSKSSYGTVKNAYNTSYSSYGSSGGTAVAVSLQFATLGIGTDTNVSIRVPASANNVVGFRPTFGILSNNGIIAYDITRDTPGAITKTIKENAILMSAMEGKNTNYINEKYDLSTVKIGVINDFYEGNNSGLYGTGTTYSKIKDLMKEYLSNLEESGVEIIYIDDFYTYKNLLVNNNTLGGWTMCSAFNKYIKNTNSSIENFYDLAYSNGHIYSLWSYVTDCARNLSEIENYDDKKSAYKEYVLNIYQKNDIDFLAYPTTKNRLLKIDESTSSFVSPSSIIAPSLGFPAASVSIGSVDGLYYGIEFLGPKNSESDLYSFLNKSEDVNNNYELSLLAKPLYTIPESVTKLLNYYEDKSFELKAHKYFIKEDQEVIKEVEDFIFNYNTYDNEEKKAIELYDKLVETNDKMGSHIYIILILIIIFITILILLKIAFKIMKKLRKEKRKRN